MSKHIVAITACAAGIAHTYMAAESLEQAGKKRGDSVRVETQGSIGAENVLSEQEIKQADVVIVAADIDIDCARFAGKRVMKVRSVDAIKDANALIERALNEATLYGEKGSKAGNITLGKTENPIIKHIMSGISYMVPMCIAAGLLLAIANVFAFQKDDLGRIVNWGFDNKTAMGYFMQKLFMVGQTGFKLMIPLFAGFVAKSIADKPAIAPAMIGQPIAFAMDALYSGLTTLNEQYAAAPFIIGAIIGAMVGFDFGGPVNKTALIFGTAVFTDTMTKYGVQGANFVPQSATQAAISVAPLGIWLASVIFKNKFSKTEKISATSAFGMGMVGVTEGAIPFAAANPLQMITASVAGSALAGGLVALTGCKFYGGIGSPLGTFIGYIEQPIPFITWILCVLAGIVVTALIIGFWRKPVVEENE